MALATNRDTTGAAAAQQLAAIRRAHQELAKCRSLPEVKEIRDVAESLRVYARNAKAGLAMQNEAAELRLSAERRAGELLAAMKLRGGDQVSTARVSRTRLADLGITRNQSTRWQRLARIPEPSFSQLVKAARNHSGELTTHALLKAASEPPAASQQTDTSAKSTAPGSPKLTSPHEILSELRSHCAVLDGLLAPVCDADGPVYLHSAERMHLRTLVREFKLLLEELERIQTMRERASAGGETTGKQ